MYSDLVDQGERGVQWPSRPGRERGVQWPIRPGKERFTVS